MNQRPTFEKNTHWRLFCKLSSFLNQQLLEQPATVYLGMLLYFLCTLPETNNLAPENRQLAPKGNVHLPTIDFLANYYSEKQHINVYVLYDIWIYIYINNIYVCIYIYQDPETNIYSINGCFKPTVYIMHVFEWMTPNLHLGLGYVPHFFCSCMSIQ